VCRTVVILWDVIAKLWDTAAKLGVVVYNFRGKVAQMLDKLANPQGVEAKLSVVGD
jgi:hypothetical protein